MITCFGWSGGSDNINLYLPRWRWSLKSLLPPRLVPRYIQAMHAYMLIWRTPVGKKYRIVVTIFGEKLTRMENWCFEAMTISFSLSLPTSARDLYEEETKSLLFGPTAVFRGSGNYTPRSLGGVKIAPGTQRSSDPSSRSPVSEPTDRPTRPRPGVARPTKLIFYWTVASRFPTIISHLYSVVYKHI